MSSLLLLAALVSKVQDATLPVFVESLPTQEEGEPMTQSETQERLKQIRERRNALQLRHGDWPCQTVHNSRERAFQQYILADIDFLLSLIDSQATGGITVSTLVGYEAELKDGKDEMRTACVERLGQVDRAHILSNNQDYERGFRDAIRSAQTALSSLTLDQVKQKEETNE